MCETSGYRSGCEEFVNIRQARLLRLPFDEPLLAHQQAKETTSGPYGYDDQPDEYRRAERP